MNNRVLLFFFAPLILMVGIKASAEEDLKSLCGNISIKQTRWYGDVVGVEGLTFWLKPVDQRCEYEVAPDALKSGQVRLLNGVVGSASPYVCFHNVTRQGGCSATSRITAVERISLEPQQSDCSTGLEGRTN